MRPFGEESDLPVPHVQARAHAVAVNRRADHLDRRERLPGVRRVVAEGNPQPARHQTFSTTGVNGGISVFLCTNLGNGPAGTQPCPAPPATISGTILAADVSPNIPATAAARTQGINTGEIDELIRAMRAGATYVNVHSTTWPGGEIRSQIDGNNSHNH